LLTIMLTDRAGTEHAARALSDGTLRFLALAVLEMDPEAHGVLCLEEPENGIHPDRVEPMLKLLQDIAFDPQLELAPDNPLRQVIINTHSPLVVGECPDDSLVLAKVVEDRRDGRVFSKALFRGVEDTWRSDSGAAVASKGELLAYRAPTSLRPTPFTLSEDGPKRIRERIDLGQTYFSGLEQSVAE